MIHNGGEPYHCSDCDKAFNRNSDLKSRLSMHTREKPYMCSQCDLSFLRNINFEIYLPIHTGEKPYQYSQLLSHFTEKAICKDIWSKILGKKHTRADYVINHSLGIVIFISI